MGEARALRREAIDVVGFRPRELLATVADGDVGAGFGEGDGRFERAVAAADNEDLLSGEVLGVVEGCDVSC